MSDELDAALAHVRAEIERAGSAVDSVSLAIARREGAEAGAAAFVGTAWVWRIIKTLAAELERRAALPLTPEQRAVVASDARAIASQLARLVDRARERLLPN